MMLALALPGDLASQWRLMLIANFNMLGEVQGREDPDSLQAALDAFDDDEHAPPDQAVH